MRIQTAAFVLCCLLGCRSQEVAESMGSIERLNERLAAVIDEGASIEKLADGFEWSEGPLWIEDHQMLLFSDVPANTIFRWKEGEGASVYLKPSGYTGTPPRGGEPGSNGLVLSPTGKLVLCQHGDRRMAVMVAPLDDPQPLFATLADNFEGKKLSSPNDAIYDREGNLYFTDPPYGLANDTLREIPFQGVYRLNIHGEISLLVDTLTRPNGIALSPDQSLLYIANSDPDKARWYEYQLSGDSISSGRIFYDATELTGTLPGLPDGMKVDSAGNIFATGPGGIFVFDSKAEVLGKISLPNPTANCALADDGKTLYITSDMNVLRIKMRH
ncbi:MAG: SMP-30/gluconolactonase/LRE family protein [Cyclobacteriaceae bacterium]